MIKTFDTSAASASTSKSDYTGVVVFLVLAAVAIIGVRMYNKHKEEEAAQQAAAKK